MKEGYKSLRSAVAVLKCFTPEEPELSGTEIARRVGLHKTSAHRILATLAEYGIVERNTKTSKYKIGTLLYYLGNLYLGTTDTLKAAEPVVTALNEITGETINVTILEKGNVIIVMKEDARYAFRIHRHIGEIVPAYSASTGKALLSELNEAELNSIIPEEKLRPLTSKTITTKTALKTELEEIRKTGVAFSRQEGYDGVVGIAYTIRNASGKAIAGMSIAVPVFRTNDNLQECLITLVKMGCSLISYKLGYFKVDLPVRDIQEIRSWWGKNKPED